MTDRDPGTEMSPEQPTPTEHVSPPDAGDSTASVMPPSSTADQAPATTPTPTLADQAPAALPPPTWAGPPSATPPPAAPSATAGAATDRRAVIAIGAALILFGAFFLLVQVLGTDFADLGWPLFVIAPGVILYVTGFIVGGRNGVGFAVAGSIVAAVGLVLAWQNTTDMWASWAYAWALVGPFAAGFGMLTYGLANRFQDLVSQGVAALAVGAALFLVGFFFFEGVVGLSGEPMPVVRDIFPYAAIGLGALLIVVSLFTGPRRSEAA